MGNGRNLHMVASGGELVPGAERYIQVGARPQLLSAVGDVPTILEILPSFHPEGVNDRLRSLLRCGQDWDASPTNRDRTRKAAEAIIVENGQQFDRFGDSLYPDFESVVYGHHTLATITLNHMNMPGNRVASDRQFLIEGEPIKMPFDFSVLIIGTAMTKNQRPDDWTIPGTLVIFPLNWGRQVTPEFIAERPYVVTELFPGNEDVQIFSFGKEGSEQSLLNIALQQGETTELTLILKKQNLLHRKGGHRTVPVEVLTANLLPDY